MTLGLLVLIAGVATLAADKRPERVEGKNGWARTDVKVTQPALHDDLMGRIVDPANMRRAWKRVKANQGAPGSDGMTLEDFPTFARSHWSAIRQALLDGTYQPKPVRRVSIPKPNGGERSLGIPSVVDRVIQ